MDIIQLRLAAQQLTGTSIKDATEMVKWFGAIQGQEYAQTKWGIGLRMPTLANDAIENKLTTGEILRTHLLRPTWHFVAAEDIGWMLQLTAPRVNAINAFMYRKLELDVALFKKCNKIIIKVLKGNKQLTRDEIKLQLKQDKIEAEGLRLVYIMMQAELEGIICSGAKRGNQFTYALLEERVKKHIAFNKKEALAELTQRYFQSRGPATAKDFSTWSGLTIKDCLEGIKMHSVKLEKISMNNNDLYFFPQADIAKVSDTIQLLPVYDEYIMGYKDRSAILQFKNHLQQNSQFHFDSMMIYKGQIIGTWKRTIGNKQIELKYQFFKSPSINQQKEFKKAIKRFSEFNNLPVQPAEV